MISSRGGREFSTCWIRGWPLKNRVPLSFPIRLPRPPQRIMQAFILGLHQSGGGIVGAFVGALGSIVSFSGYAKGIVAILAGGFMIIMGINMLNIFPSLKKFNPRLPRFIVNFMNHEKIKSNSQFYVGLLNGLMPCGPLQAMQLYALSKGSFIYGALSMFIFCLGTIPLMLFIGVISNYLNNNTSIFVSHNQEEKATKVNLAYNF